MSKAFEGYTGMEMLGGGAEDAKRPPETPESHDEGAERPTCDPAAPRAKTPSEMLDELTEAEACEGTYNTPTLQQMQSDLAVPSLVAEATPAAVVLRFDPERLRGKDRVACGEPAAWDAAFLANKLGADLLLGVSEYVTQLGLELRRRHVEHVAALLRAETEAWRAAGCLGKAPLVERDGTVTRREPHAAELARNVLAELEAL